MTFDYHERNLETGQFLSKKDRAINILDIFYSGRWGVRDDGWAIWPDGSKDSQWEIYDNATGRHCCYIFGSELEKAKAYLEELGYNVDTDNWDWSIY